MGLSSLRPSVVRIDQQGHRKECSLSDIAYMELTDLAPVRQVTAYKGQRHMPGRYWFSTTGEHVIYESRMEMKALLMLDFDPEVVEVAAQPFALRFPQGYCGERASRLHVPDYFASRLAGPRCLIDVKLPEQAVKPKNKSLFDATRKACATVGWDYRVVSGYDPVVLANVEWLSGFRRTPPMFEVIGPAIEGAVRGSSGERLGNLLRAFRGPQLEMLARPVAFYLLWKHALCADLSEPLSEETVVSANEKKGSAHGA